MKIKNGYKMLSPILSEHRHIYTNVHGKIQPGWVIHHIDENKLNNDIGNLIALPERLHNKIHDYMRKRRVHLDRHSCEEFLKKFLKGISPKAYKRSERKKTRKQLRKERGKLKEMVKVQRTTPLLSEFSPHQRLDYVIRGKSKIVKVIPNSKPAFIIRKKAL